MPTIKSLLLKDKRIRMKRHSPSSSATPPKKKNKKMSQDESKIIMEAARYHGRDNLDEICSDPKVEVLNRDRKHIFNHINHIYRQRQQREELIEEEEVAENEPSEENTDEPSDEPEEEPTETDQQSERTEQQFIREAQIRKRVGERNNIINTIKNNKKIENNIKWREGLSWSVNRRLINNLCYNY